MNSDDPLKALRDAAFLKLGRNIALFQHLEFSLKTLYTELVVQGCSVEDAALRRTKREAEIATSSLGLVAKALFDELAAPDDVDAERPIPEGAPFYLRMRTRFEGPVIDARRSAIASLIAERNQLVHHLNQRYDLASSEGIARLDANLDPQADRIRGEIREVGRLAHDVARGRKALGEWLGSQGFKAWLDQEVEQVGFPKAAK